MIVFSTHSFTYPQFMLYKASSFVCAVLSELSHIQSTINPSAWGHLNRSSYCDVGRLFYGVFKLWSKLQRKK